MYCKISVQSILLIKTVNEEIKMEYCDLIAANVVAALKSISEPVAFFGIETKLDLDPEGGFLVSTDKAVYCRDNKGTKYKITVEAKSERSMEDMLQASNLKHSRNGDPVGHTIEALATKLSFALQDSTVLAEITEAELHMLEMEVKNAIEAKENPIESF
jgi:hypothetical protein